MEYVDTAFTVQQLIDELMKIEDKNKKVFFERDSWSIEAIRSVYNGYTTEEQNIVFVGT